MANFDDQNDGRDPNKTVFKNVRQNADDSASSKISEQVGVKDRTDIENKDSQKELETAQDKTVFVNKKTVNANLNDKTQLASRPANPNATVIKKTETPISQGHDSTRFKAPDKKPKAQVEKHNQVEEHNRTQVKKPSPQEPVEPRPMPSTTATGSYLQVLKDRFVLEEVLGAGGMGVVYKAKDRLKVEAKDSDPYVAIKVLSEEFKSHPEAFISLQRESRKTQRIANPNTVKVYDFDRDGDNVFMTMEYLVGQPLDQMVKQYHATGLPRNEAWKILLGMCTALTHAHEENIVHSDLKPGNVYVTENGTAKIFDFGIARAVANIDRHTGENLDRTVFDAGNLGALTPAYASLEMLMGHTPDTRDDIYALGCVAYEILTGEHPFTRLPADEAFKKKLKPKRIPDINKRQWKAIEAALAFERKDRIESVEEFHKQLTAKGKAKPVVAIAAVTLIGISLFVFNQFIEKPVTEVSQSEIRDELEFEIRYKLFKKNIEELLANPSFSPEWENTMWNNIEGVKGIFEGEPDEWYVTTKTKVYQLYIDKINEVIEKSNFEFATGLIDNAYRYTNDPSELDESKVKLADMIRQEQLRREEEKRLAQEQEKVNKAKQKQTAEKRKQNSLFNVANANVNKHLECASTLNMRDFKIAIEKLRSIDLARYKKLEGTITDQLAQCITAIGKINPEHAKDSKRYALRIFKNNSALTAVTIKPRDDCNSAIAGLGARGERAVCRDKFQNGGLGPTLVVIPSNNRIKSFAIGKYEISLAEIENYCKKSKECSMQATGNKNLPVTKVNIETISNYLKWLSKTTRKKYRLPTRREWVYAAKSNSKNKLDSNRNCQLSTRGIEKGGELVRTTTGRQNAWGLVNYAGNAQELVYDTGRKLVAVGGSFKSSMESCNPTTITSHSGSPDEVTGFRVARELADN